MDTEQAISDLCAYLRQVRRTSAYPVSEDGGHEAPDGWTPEASPAADTAREWARELLKAADANGACGCLLCRS